MVETEECLSWVGKEKSINNEDEVICMHPDLEERKSAPRHFLRGNVASIKCEICLFCGLACRKLKNPISENKRMAHFVGINFIYCPNQGKAFRTVGLSAGEICPPELGGCGCFILPK